MTMRTMAILALLLAIAGRVSADEKQMLFCAYRITSADGTILNESNGVLDGDYVLHLIRCEVRGSHLSSQFIRSVTNMTDFKRVRVSINGEKVPEHLIHVNRKVQEYVLLEFPDVTDGIVEIEVLAKVGTSP